MLLLLLSVTAESSRLIQRPSFGFCFLNQLALGEEKVHHAERQVTGHKRTALLRLLGKGKGSAVQSHRPNTATP